MGKIRLQEILYDFCENQGLQVEWLFDIPEPAKTHYVHHVVNTALSAGLSVLFGVGAFRVLSFGFYRWVGNVLGHEVIVLNVRTKEVFAFDLNNPRCLDSLLAVLCR